MSDYVQPALPGFEELVVPPFPDLQEMLEYLDAISRDSLPKRVKTLSMTKVFGLTNDEAIQVALYWEALPKKEKKDD